ncbi:cell envelope integrity protein TolA [Sphingobium sp. H33]|uniref:Cell envelope integrity protein TolA n=1 Tax=Sphingobium nicotianae TaxID=2782607 RepID=A0A9X1ISR9_9SPHN|nr:cell envelope integrity protein TolA [Sphingobium nicotianae]
MPVSGRGGYGRERKLGPLALTVLLHILVIGLLLLQKGAPVPRKIEESLTTVFMPEAKEDKGDKAKAKTEQKEKKRESASAASEPKPTPTPPVEQPKTPPPPIPIGPSWLNMSRAEFAASDISKMARAQRNTGDSGDTGDSSSTYGPGEGPGGVRLYNADWYRKPTDAEIGGYMTASMPRRGWGLIACQTIERYHVDNCQTLGESPLGSGFGRAVREAAWQFLVMPPRINGKPQVGAWVRIRIDYGVTEGGPDKPG